MKIIHKNESVSWQTKTTKGFEYPFGVQNIDCAVVEIHGRHPLDGWYQNTKVDEMIYCKNGQGCIVFESGEVHRLEEDDAVFIPKKDWYYWDAKTNGTFVAMCNPAWTQEQGQVKKID